MHYKSYLLTREFQQLEMVFRQTGRRTWIQLVFAAHSEEVYWRVQHFLQGLLEKLLEHPVLIDASLIQTLFEIRLSDYQNQIIVLAIDNAFDREVKYLVLLNLNLFNPLWLFSPTNSILIDTSLIQTWIDLKIYFKTNIIWLLDTSF